MRDRTQWRWSGDQGGSGWAVAYGAVARAVKSSRAHLDLEVEDLGTAVARDADAAAPQLGQPEVVFVRIEDDVVGGPRRVQLAAVTGSTTLLAARTWTILNVVGMARRIFKGRGARPKRLRFPAGLTKRQTRSLRRDMEQSGRFRESEPRKNPGGSNKHRGFGSGDNRLGECSSRSVDDPCRWRVHTDSGMIHLTATRCRAAPSAGCGSVGLGRG